jgi:hypothetical protein
MIGVLGCGTAPIAPSAAPAAVIPTHGAAAPLVSPSASPTTTSPTPAPTSAPTTKPKATPIVKPTATWTELERDIWDAIRDDARVACAPRHNDLPPRTIAAVECQPGKASVSQVAFYLFAKPDDAFQVYSRRIEEAGMELLWSDPLGWEESPSPECQSGEVVQTTCRDRQAEFLNKEGYANYRAVIGRMYIGVLGTNPDMDAQAKWAWGQKDESGQDDAGPRLFQTLWCEGQAPEPDSPICKITY